MDNTSLVTTVFSGETLNLEFRANCPSCYHMHRFEDESLEKIVCSECSAEFNLFYDWK